MSDSNLEKRTCDDNKTEDESDSDVKKINIYMEKTINRDLAIINTKINEMPQNKIYSKFRWFKYDNTDFQEYRKHLRLALSQIIRENIDSLYSNDSILPYYVIVDFEATCELVNPEQYQHEIIEFPAVLVDSKKLEIVDSFRRICRPTFKHKLSDFCTELTGITQEEVDNAEPFTQVLKSFEAWLKSHKLGSKRKFTIVSDGPWDMTRFLFVQCILSNIDYPKWAEKWLDIRRIFKKFYQQKRSSLAAMLEYLGMNFEGRPHCGIDDATNIARVLLKMICDGASLYPNLVIAPASKKAKNMLKESLDPKKSIIDQLRDTPLEANSLPVQVNVKILTHRDVKIERTKKIHELAKSSYGSEQVKQNSLKELDIDLTSPRISRRNRR